MSNLKTFIILIVLALCIFSSAGCTADTGIPVTADKSSESQTYQAVSFNDTPVDYAQVNGVTLGYREGQERHCS